MKYLISALFILTLFSCKKDTQDFQNGIVLDFGDPAVDGCGWMVQVGNTVYKPTNLANSFQVDSQTVLIEFKNLGTAAGCGFNPNAHTEIQVLNIKKR